MTEQEHKHRCAIRQLLIYFNEMGANGFAKFLEKHRINPAWVDEAREQYRKGNRGRDNEWYE